MENKSFIEVEAKIHKFIRSMVYANFVKKIDVQATVSAVSGMDAILSRGLKTMPRFQAIIVLGFNYPQPLPDKFENKFYDFKVMFIFERESSIQVEKARPRQLL